jgi:DNA-binding NarL/FixJ family response regulator
VPTVLIVDDHKVFRASARKLLELDGFVVVGEAGDAATGTALAFKLQPELVLLDVALPDGSGFEVAAQLRGTRSTVVLVSSRDPADFGMKAAASGAAGFISKERLTTEAIRELLEKAA